MWHGRPSHDCFFTRARCPCHRGFIPKQTRADGFYPHKTTRIRKSVCPSVPPVFVSHWETIQRPGGTPAIPGNGQTPGIAARSRLRHLQFIPPRQCFFVAHMCALLGRNETHRMARAGSIAPSNGSKGTWEQASSVRSGRFDRFSRCRTFRPVCHRQTAVCRRESGECQTGVRCPWQDIA